MNFAISLTEQLLQDAALLNTLVDKKEVLNFVTKIIEAASDRFIAEKEASSLVKTLNTLFKEYKAFLNNKESVHLLVKELSRDGVKCVLLVILKDRPFIVSSLVEALRARNAQLNHLIHPLLEGDPSQISLNYIEIELPLNSSDNLNASKALVDEITVALSDTITVTDSISTMLLRIDQSASLCERVPYNLPQGRYSMLERAQLLRWLIDDSFVILGVTTLSSDGGSLKHSHSLGIASKIESALTPDLINFAGESNEISVTRLPIKSCVLRRQFLTHIAVALSPEVESGGEPSNSISIVGIFSTKGLRDDSRSIPVLRVKVRDIIEELKVGSNSHDYQYAVETLNRMPKDLSLRLPKETLIEIITAGIKVYSRNYLRVTACRDGASNNVIAVVLLPKEVFNDELRESIAEKLEDYFNCQPSSAEAAIDIGAVPQARLYFFLPLSTPPDETLLTLSSLQQLESNLSVLTNSWDDKFAENFRKVVAHLPSLRSVIQDGEELYFPLEYRSTHTPEEAINNLLAICRLSSIRPLVVKIHNIKDGVNLSIFSLKSSLPLSTSIPIFENMNLEVCSSATFKFEVPTIGEVSVNKLHLSPRKPLEDRFFSGELSLEGVEEFIESLLTRNENNDLLNSLALSAGLDAFNIRVLRSYTHLLWQVTSATSKIGIKEALARVPEVTRLLVETFKLKFSISEGISPEGERAVATKANLNKIYDALQEVSDIATDRAIRDITSLIKGTVRTNAYSDFFTSSKTLAHKINSRSLPLMPIPRPEYEIFVFGNRVEGTHLRSSKVARGGIRWSERVDDYRSEVLGLMKTQRVKNVLIVPSGAKGGFITRGEIPPEGARAAVQASYQEYIRAMLSIADNYVSSPDGSTEITRPPGVICYDESDPYFVVAADKGTATFSDVANSIALAEFKNWRGASFWLGDAFASGGSNGYDHKKYGITARGAWEAVMRHFDDLNLEYRQSPFSVIGIGDMSGDVFGNGLLLSRQMSLKAAFNHQHIFLDPTPNVEESYKERERLFNLPRTTWNDYSSELISKGGGVFERRDKAITLSAEARLTLAIPDSVPESVSGEELIKLILQAPCDLLWNGGIGTYVKATAEAHVQVSDGTNDGVRINASNLRCKVFGEGGNLGITQLGRIEFAQNGGRINTDAIDNSGGVDLSDHEVNIKVLLTGIVRRGELDEAGRNSLLREIDNEVVEDVLSNNRSQVLTLTLGVERSPLNMTYFSSILRDLNKAGFLEGFIEQLPNEQALAERALKGIGLTRPEFAVILAGVKMHVKDTLLEILTSESNADITYLKDKYLLPYFPLKLQERFSQDILNHPLWQNVTATTATNHVVDTVGVTFTHRMALLLGVSLKNVLQGLLAADGLIGGRDLRKALFTLPHASQEFSNAKYLDLHRSLGNCMRASSEWFLHREGTHTVSTPITRLIERYGKGVAEIAREPHLYLNSASLSRYEERITELSALPPEVSSRIAFLDSVPDALELVYLQGKSGQSLYLVNQARLLLSEVLKVGELQEALTRADVRTKWEQQANSLARDELGRGLGKFVTAFLKSSDEESIEILKQGEGLNLVSVITEKPEHYFKNLISFSEHQDYLNIANQIILGSASPSAFYVLANRLRFLSSKVL